MARRFHVALIFRIVPALALALLLTACDGEEPPQSTTWLEGEPQEQRDALANQLGGFSQAMIEVGYRYNELYLAGQDGNWGLADYHAGKIDEAIRRGVERDPDRGPNALRFLDHDFVHVREAIEQQDAQLFADRIEIVRGDCNACHMREQVGFIHIAQPERRVLPWETPAYLRPE